MARDNRSLPYEIKYATAGGVSQVVPVAGYDTANVAAIGNATTGVLTLYGGVTPSGPWVSLTETVTGTGESGPFSIAGYPYLGIAVTTAEADKTAQVTVYMTESGV